MSKITFNTFIDMSSAATPSSGYLVAYDLDGILKQKDEFGVITSVGSSTNSGTQSFTNVLSVNNETGPYDVVITAGQTIKSSTGSSYLSLDDGGSNAIRLDVTGSGVYVDSTTSQLYSTTNIYMDSPNIQLSSTAIFDIGCGTGWNIQMIENTSNPATGSVNNKSALFLNTSDSIFDAGIINSVIIGGTTLVATQSNTVYLGNSVNINNAYTLPNTDGASNQVLKTDGFGNVNWQTEGGNYKKYVALVTQTSTNAPVSLVLENTLSGTPSWTYSTTGQYYLELTGEFLAEKVFILIGRNTGTPGDGFEMYRSDDDRLRLDSTLFNSGSGTWNFSDGRLSSTSIEVRVYL